MDRERFELKVGIFVFIGIVALGVIIVLLGSKQDMFSRQYPLYAAFEDVGGLKPGAPVRLAGVDVGTVERIDLPATPGDKQLRVRMMIRSEVSDRIRQDSKAEISTQGVLGDKYVAVTLGTEGEPHKPNDTILSEQPADYFAFLETAGKAAGNIASITAKLDAMISSSAGGATKSSVAMTLSNLAAITGEVQHGHGLLHELIYDPKGAQTIDQLHDTAANLAAVTGDIKAGKGALGELLNDPKGKEAIAKIYDAAGNLDTTTKNFAEVSKKVNDGEGTLGALVNDDGVYDDIRALLGRAKRNRILRTVIRHTIDKNEKLPEGNTPETTPTPSQGT